ncbi:MAG TPA: HEAT repeat domain-containing protein [Pirellulales bacterium]|nr:HEAT repeat domain-containing protein [Pirellulales bacterium]
MKFDLAVMHGWIVRELARCRPVAESMSRLLDECEAKYPHPDWSRIRSLPFGDLSSLLAWIQQPFVDDPPRDPLRGLWFGLFNPCPDGRPVSDIYVCGSERFDPDPGDNSWAVGPDWWPKGRYAESALLAAIYRIAYREDTNDPKQKKRCLGNAAEYTLCLGYGAFVVRGLLAQVNRSLILGNSKTLGIAVGFDSGDFLLLGELSDDGIRAVEPRARRENSLALHIEELRSSNERIVFRAIYALKRLRDDAREAVPELIRLARDAQQFGVRQAAVITLTAIAPEDPRARSAVLAAFEDTSPFVRRQALQAIISAKGLSARDLARIQAMANDPDGVVADWSEIALRNISLSAGGDPKPGPAGGPDED